MSPKNLQSKLSLKTKPDLQKDRGRTEYSKLNYVPNLHPLCRPHRDVLDEVRFSKIVEQLFFHA